MMTYMAIGTAFLMFFVVKPAIDVIMEKELAFWKKALYVAIAVAVFFGTTGLFGLYSVSASKTDLIEGNKIFWSRLGAKEQR